MGSFRMWDCGTESMRDLNILCELKNGAIFLIEIIFDFFISSSCGIFLWNNHIWTGLATNAFFLFCIFWCQKGVGSRFFYGFLLIDISIFEDSVKLCVSLFGCCEFLWLALRVLAYQRRGEPSTRRSWLIIWCWRGLETSWRGKTTNTWRRKAICRIGTRTGMFWRCKCHFFFCFCSLGSHRLEFDVIDSSGCLELFFHC